MKWMVLLFSSLLIITGCRQHTPATTQQAVAEKAIQHYAGADSFLILPGKSLGLVHADFNYDSLVDYVGEANLEDDSTCGIECIDTFVVTVLWKGQPREIEIMWQDSFFHQKIALISIYNQQSPYHTVNGIAPGTTLESLEKLNGKPIFFRGFGWDYGGGITSCNNGKLDSLDLSITLDCDQATCSDKYLGESEFSSANVDPVEKKKIHISELFITF